MHARACRFFVVGIAWTVTPTGGWAQQPVMAPVASHRQSPSASSGSMKDHFAQAMSVHTIIVRGDMEALGPAARQWLAQIDQTSWPAAAAGPVEALRRAAREVAAATSLGTAASAIGRMLAACGSCHRATGVMPAPPPAPLHNLGGIVGHMLDHQRALTHMLEGLVVPSTSLWRQGAESLRVAPLRDNRLPHDADTAALKALEQQVHEVADRAATVEAGDGRAAVYGELVASCAGCRSLHVKVWGPTPR